MIRRILWLLPALLLPVAAHGANIFEGVTTSPLFDVDPSVRWRAMGDAGTAGFWDPTNAWANPALVGSAKGVQYEAGTMDHDLVDFETARTTLGWGGIGWSTTGRPFSGLGKVEMDFGGLYSESVRSWSVGLSASQVAATVAHLGGRDAPGFTRWFDFEVGYSGKEARDSFSPDLSPVVAHDLGLLLRAGAPVGPARVDVAWGSSAIDSDGPRQSIGNAPTRISRNGVAARATWDPVTMQSRIPNWLRSAVSPIVSAGGSMDFVDHRNGDSSLHEWGAELGLANILFGRIGRSGQSNAWGLGAGIPLGRFAAVRWDHVYRERLDGVPDERSDAWTVWMDPLAIVGAVR